MVFIKALSTSVKDMTRAGGDVPMRGEMQFIFQKALFSVGDHPPMKYSTLALVMDGIMDFVYKYGAFGMAVVVQDSTSGLRLGGCFTADL